MAIRTDSGKVAEVKGLCSLFLQFMWLAGWFLPAGILKDLRESQLFKDRTE